MKTVPIVGTGRSVTFFEDDKVETVRQLIALEMESHPDRLFIEVNTVLPANYYSSSPKHWGELFFRLSADGRTISLETMRTYLAEKRIATQMVAREFTKEEWDQHGEDLAPIYFSELDFSEWRILGVPVVSSIVLPLPPRDVGIPSSRIPIVSNQSLYETIHPYDISEVRVTPLPVGASEIVKRVYYPVLVRDTPVTIESMREFLQDNQSQLKKLLELKAPKHEDVAIVHVKWYIGFQSTEFTNPRNRFEQIFYGMTVSEETPYIGLFTAKTDVIRHKFFVEDPKNKQPFLDTSLFKGWLIASLPQRRKPTLLLYRGKSRFSFDRIAVTDKDIIIDVRRESSSTETLETKQKTIRKWLESLDALIPYINELDLDSSRWELSSMSVNATYSKSMPQETFDMRRFPCMRPIFSYVNNSFRLLRADTNLEGIDSQVLTAYQILSSSDQPSPELLSSEMGLSIEDASSLFENVQEAANEVNLEKAVKTYPTVIFSEKAVLLKFVTNLERTLEYVDILRHILTSDSDAVNEVCPRRMEEVAPTMVVPQQAINEEDVEADEDLLAALGISVEEPPPEEEVVSAPAAAATAAPSRPRPVGQTKTTFSYFVNRLKKFDSNTFDMKLYPGLCDKFKQAIVLTPEDKTRIGSEYNYESAPANQKLELTDPEGTVICPPYWCMRDEIPLREDQLVTKDDGFQHCPMCNGKVRVNDTASSVEFSVIKRDTAMKYPDFLKQESSRNNRKMPCCYKTPRVESKPIRSTSDVSYVYQDSATSIPELRMAFLSPEFADRMRITTSYAKSVSKGKLNPDESDVFRIGLGQPRSSLPILLGDKTPILEPKDAPENVKKCSFFPTWRQTRPGDSATDRILASIQEAYTEKTLNVLEELEYVTTFLKCRVILIDSTMMNVTCGFWSDVISAESRTIVVIGSDVLGHVSAKKKGRKVLEYTIDIQKPPFKDTTLPVLKDLHKQACLTNMPLFQDALAELERIGSPAYELLLDPFDRVQALLVPGKVILPIHPTSTRPPGISIRNGYIDVKDTDLPNGSDLREFLEKSIHPGFRKAGDVQNTKGQTVEFLLASGFRVPINPEVPQEGVKPAGEVIQTVRKHGEESLVKGEPNAEDLREARKIAYQTEMYEFLLFSLSKDIRPGEDYEHLRGMIQSRSPDLYRELKRWYEAKSYSEAVESPISFINKVRTPCGQFKTNETACKESSLCGWHAGTCKIKVNPVIDKTTILNRLAKSLRDNVKQRGLVLDDRLSPFFSTVLYLEMPNELITTEL